MITSVGRNTANLFILTESGLVTSCDIYIQLYKLPGIHYLNPIGFTITLIKLRTFTNNFIYFIHIFQYYLTD